MNKTIQDLKVEIEAIKKTLAMAPEMERAMMNLKLLELEGATKWEEKNI